MQTLARWMIVVAVAASATVSSFAGSAVGGSVTPTNFAQYPQRYEFSFVTGTNDGAVAWTSDYVRGSIERVVFAPGPAPYPTNLYDVTLKDANGFDVLAGLGQNLSSNTASQVVPALASGVAPMTTSACPFVVNDRLILGVTNADFGKQGRVILYVK